MGNHISCVSLSANPSKMVKILHLSCGSVQEFEGPMKAAELTLENPHHFVCHSNALQMGRRIAALPADEHLKNGETYLLIAMPKLHSQLSPAERAFLAAASISHSNTKRRGSDAAAKLLPLFGDSLQGDLQEAPKTPQFVVPKLHLDGLSQQHLAFGKQRVSGCRNWKPVLDTISEAPRLLQG